MAERLLELALDESKWVFAAMVVALGTVAARLRGRRRRALAPRLSVLWAMNLFHGVLIGVLALGHLLAVGLRAADGSLAGSLVPLLLLGVLLAVPSWWLVLAIDRYVDEPARFRRRLVTLDLALGVALLALGLHNAPLAAPAFLCAAHAVHTRRAVGWTIVGLTVALQLLLFAGSIVFLASGQSFEQF